jgi:hypothetical protein
VENQSLFIAFLIAWVVYVPLVYLIGWRFKLSPILTTLSHIYPTAVALAMARIFLLGSGHTIRQYNVGSPAAENLWSLWAGLWPLLLLAGLGSAIMLLRAIHMGAWRQLPIRSLAITVPSFAMSVFAFITVFINFPDA